MKFGSFGYIVDSCPGNKTEYTDSATRLGCGVDENRRSQYVCVPNNERSSLVEFCYKSTVGFYEKGNCIEVYESGNLDQTSCLRFKFGCPDNHFFLSDLYKFPDCHGINLEDRCFYADPTCPNVTILPDKLPENRPLHTGTVAGITIGVVGVILAVILVIFAVVKRREKSSKDARRESEDIDEESQKLISKNESSKKAADARESEDIDEESQKLISKNESPKKAADARESEDIDEESQKLISKNESPKKTADARESEDIDEESQKLISKNESPKKTADARESEDIDEESQKLISKNESPKKTADARESEDIDEESQKLISKNESPKKTADARESEDIDEESQKLISKNESPKKTADARESEDIDEESQKLISKNESPKKTADARESEDIDEESQKLISKNESPKKAADARESEDIDEESQKLISKNESPKKAADYCVWKTDISDQFSTLTDDEVLVLFCFLCSDSGPPDFTDREWLDILNQIRRKVYRTRNLVASEEAQQTLERLKSLDFLWEDQDKININDYTKDETMYKLSQKCNIYFQLPFYISSHKTATRYLRSNGYTRKFGEKCVISNCSTCDRLLILRLQIDILPYVTMKDKGIYKLLVQFLNTPGNQIRRDQIERKQLIKILKENGEAVHYRGRSQDRVDHVTWLWRYEFYARPDIVRSCIGLHPHNDIYIIDNKPYRKPSKYHKYSEVDRSFLYSLLLCDKYTATIKGEAFQSMLIKILERYYQKSSPCDDIDISPLQNEIKETQNGEITFILDDIRHDVMYAFVTECLVEDSDLEFFLKTASRDVISEYCRSWYYKRSEGERCLYVPDRPKNMYNLFIDKLQLDFITHCTVSDKWIHNTISKRLKIPEEILSWDKKARERYVEYAMKGTQTVHHARGMIVGCAGAGKTTLLKRLLQCSEEEILNVKSTEGLEVHEEEFEIFEETRTLKVRKTNNDGKKENPYNSGQKTLSFYDFGGQCAYYACHQIYLTRRAFYVVVVDASKDPELLVERDVCDQMDTLFANWKYKDYFLFWMKSIHTYCYGNSRNDRDSDVIILLIATHWDKRVHKDKATFLDCLQNVLPANSNLVQYIREDRCFCTQFPITPLKDLEDFIVQLVAQEKWSEQIPVEWVFFEDKIQKEKKKRVLIFKEIEKVLMHHGNEKQILDRAKDMLRYHHEAGKILHFDEEYLKSSVIIDVQWFVNAFKFIMTDRHHVKGIIAKKQDWDEFYKTGNLKDALLNDIWKSEDKRLFDTLVAKTLSENTNFEKDSRSLMYHKEELLLYMQRLGLISSEGKTHYVPSMNKKDFGETQKEIIKMSNSKSSVLVYLFDFLPYFFFYRLVVALMQIENWKVLTSNGISCLYKNAAMFSHESHNIAAAVSPSTIQLQIFQSNSQTTMLHEVTLSIRKKVESILQSVTKSFHKSLEYEVGFICDREENQIVGREVSHNFIEESMLGSGSQVTCPKHQVEGFHTINPDYLLKYWK